MQVKLLIKVLALSVIHGSIYIAITCFSYPEEPTVGEILNWHADAMGGAERWENLSSYQQTWTKPSGMTLTMTCKMPDQITLHFKKDSFELIKGYDGEHGYLVRNGQYESMRPGEAIEMAEEPHYYSELIRAKQQLTKVAYLGKEMVDGISCYKLKLTKSTVDVQLYWLNTKTFLIEQTGEYSEDKAHEGIYYKTRLEDYREVQGLMFPFKQTLIPSDRPAIASIVTQTKVALGLQDSVFQYHPDRTSNLIRYWKDRYAQEVLPAFTFVQETVRYREGKPADTATWYEAMQHPNFFRIDFGDKNNGSGNLYRNDSVYVMRKDSIVHRGAQVQEFMVMSDGLYAWPVDTTLNKLKAIGINPDVFDLVWYKGRLLYCIGAKAGDTTAPQVWVDAKRRYTVKQWLKGKKQGVVHAEFSDFKQFDGHWVEGWVEFSRDGQLLQTEQYRQIDVHPKLTPDMFNPAHFQEHFWY